MRSDLLIRKACLEDHSELISFFNTQEVFHRHFDWLAAIDWLGTQPFFLAIRNHRIVSAIACPEYPENHAWIRFFYFSQTENPAELFKEFMARVLESYSSSVRPIHIACLSTHPWFSHILQSNHFFFTQQIVVLECHNPGNFDLLRQMDKFTFRPMTGNDLMVIQKIDDQSFPPLWRIPIQSLQAALKLTPYGTLVELHGIPVGYQISNTHHRNIHLSRLAVIPQFQHQSIGCHLVLDVIREAYRRDINLITVNTQSDNFNSMALYKKNGFTYSGEQYPVWLHHGR